jgi:pyridoxine 5-phosphate synthase
MAARLSVNVDHVATVRQARKGQEPDPVAAATLAELAGCHGIIVHLREDRRHIQDRDVEVLRRTVKTRLNLEMAATDEMIGIALRLKPDMCTLVPEKREELTTEGGLDVARHFDQVRRAVQALQEGTITVSLFIDTDAGQIQAAKDAGAEVVELHTGTYSDARTEHARARELKAIVESATCAVQRGLRVHAGHGLDYQNIQALTALKDIEEFSIGHSIMARSLLVGIGQAVREMIDLIRQP